MDARFDLEWLREKARDGEILGVSVHHLPMSTRAKNLAWNAGARNARMLVELDEVEFVKQPGCGKKAISAIRAMRTVIRTLVEEAAQ
jgi:hypothetical protein